MHLKRLIVSALLGLCVSSCFASWDETPDVVARRSRSLLTDPTTFGVGILSTIYPQDYYIEELRGFVTSGSDYFAPCFANGDLVVLALPVSSNWRNALSSPGKNATFTVVSNVDPSVPDPRHETADGQWDPTRPDWRRGMYSKQRLTLFGHLQTDKAQATISEEARKCYLTYHPDAKHFVPGSKDSPHLAIWTRFVVDRVYRVGGYGDESQIGWLDMHRWRSAGGDAQEAAAGWQLESSSQADVPTSGNTDCERNIATLFAEQQGSPDTLFFQRER